MSENNPTENSLENIRNFSIIKKQAGPVVKKYEKSRVCEGSGCVYNVYRL